MSTLKVEIVSIDEIIPHDNAERLEIAQIKGWHCVVGKGQFKKGDAAIYFPVDSVLPPTVEKVLFPPDSKITLNKGRIKSIRIRGAMSQGLLATTDKFFSDNKMPVGMDVTEILGVKKYEPEEEPAYIGRSPTRSRRGKNSTNSQFIKYTDIENFKNYNNEFVEGEEVYITEKLHGTSFRCGWFRRENLNIFVRFYLWFMLKIFGIDKGWEFLIGSRNLEVSHDPSSNVYAKIVEQYKLKDILPIGMAVYGEIVGDGIQRGYSYGCKQNEHKLYLYDIRVNGKWLDAAEFMRQADMLKIPRVPLLHFGAFNADYAKKLTEGDSTIGEQKVREGVVIKAVAEHNTPKLGRKVLKLISDEYYLNKHNTDFH